MEKKDLFFIQSLNVAAFLKCKGFEVVNLEKNNNITTFYFNKSDELYKAIDEYNNNNELKKFINSFREIKNMMKDLNK